MDPAPDTGTTLRSGGLAGLLPDQPPAPLAEAVVVSSGDAAGVAAPRGALSIDLTDLPDQPDLRSALPAEALLPARPDARFDRVVALVRRLLGTPVALVTLVDRGGQVFPGAVGLEEPWASSRCTPLSHSFCQHVVASGRPLVVTDSRTDERVRGNGAIEDLGVVAYLGVPLTGRDGSVLGSLCAIDHEPRTWTAEELSLLSDLAASVSSELQLRQAAREADRERAEAEVARSEAVAAGGVAERARTQSDVLLHLSEALADAHTVADVARTVSRLCEDGLGAVYTTVAVADLERRTLQLLDLHALPPRTARAWAVRRLDDPSPVTDAARLQVTGVYGDLDEVCADYPHLRGDMQDAGLEAVITVPLTHGDGESLGSLLVAWRCSRTVTAEERTLVAAIARYAGQALHRALLIDGARDVAHVLQQALLPHLPRRPGLELVGRYLPSSRTTQVGGDWYDAFALPDGPTALVIGDVTGHDVRAAAQMGALRHLLRGLAWDRDQSPAQTLSRLDDALQGLASDKIATAVLGRLGVDGELVWSSAGHLPPLLLHADGRAELLQTESDMLLGVRTGTPRHDHAHQLEVGQTLVLYTDGLVERRGEVLDRGLQRLAVTAQGLGALGPGELLDALVGRLAGDAPEDDIALLAVRRTP